MYNGTAYVNVSNEKMPIYRLNSGYTNVTSEQIGTIYPNECYGVHSGEGSAQLVAFRNASGNTQVGGVVDNFPKRVPYGEKKSNGSTLVDNPMDSQGYYTHTLAKTMNWYS